MHVKLLYKTAFFILFFLTANVPLFSQNNNRGSMSEYYQQAQEFMKNDDYEAANIAFRKILKLGTKLPAEMPYLFAETLYQIEQYQNSKSFLDKYFEIMGKAGTYYENAVELEDKLEKKLNRAFSCSYCDYSGYRLKTCEVCNGEKQLLEECHYCAGVGKVGCEICAGEGVLVQLGPLGNKSYKTCHRCKGEGIHTCSICEGEKEFYNYCSNCLGVGKVATSVICNHKPLSN